MSANLVCWKCAASLSAYSLPLERLAECKQCHADLHVCRLCQFYNPRLSDHCDEPMAEFVREIERANFCDYFKPRAHAFVAADSQATQAARSELDALFGKPAASASKSSGTDTHSEWEALFGIKKDKDDGK